MPDYVGSSKHNISERTLSTSLENRLERPDTRATLSFGNYLAKCQALKSNPILHPIM